MTWVTVSCLSIHRYGNQPIILKRKIPVHVLLLRTVCQLKLCLILYIYMVRTLSVQGAKLTGKYYMHAGQTFIIKCSNVLLELT